MAYDMISNGYCRICDEFTFQDVAKSSNGATSYAIDENGSLWSWGGSNSGQAGQGNPQYEYDGGQIWNVPENRWIVSPRIMETSEGETKTDLVKITYGEYSAMAIDSDGVLWGCGTCYYNDRADENCAPFGLPHDSGTDELAWKDGVDPRTNYQNYFFKLTKCAPAYTFKDFYHVYYHTFMIGTDDKLYFMGHETGWGGSGFGTTEASYPDPTRVTGVSEDVKLLAQNGEFGYAFSGCVTSDDTVYIWGDEWTYFDETYDDINCPITDITDNLPTSSAIKAFSLGYEIILILFEDGTVYGRGNSYSVGNGWYGEDSFNSWVQISQLSDIDSIGLSQDGCHAIDSDGNLWTWGAGTYLTGKSSSDYFEYPTIAADRQFLAFAQDQHQGAMFAVDSNGQLVTWGYQGYEPRLGIGTADEQYINDLLGITESTVLLSETPVICDYDSETCYHTGSTKFATELVGFSEQENDHFPCGHWHTGPSQVSDVWPHNCWQPAIDIDGSNVLLIASGKFGDYTGSGYHIVFALYNSSTNNWTNIYQDTLVYTAGLVGQAAIKSSVYGYANYKYDVDSTDYSFSNPAFMVMIWETDTMNITEFADASVEKGYNKFDVTSGGNAAVIYTDDTSGEAYVKVSTNYGSSWTTKKTLTANSDRKDYGLKIDPSGNIYIAYMVNATTVTIEKSTDDGSSWTNQGSITTQSITEEEIHFDISDGDLFVTIDGAVYYSEDDGSTWTAVIKANLTTACCGYGTDNIIFGVTDNSDTQFNRYDISEDSWTVVGEGINITNTRSSIAESSGVFAYTHDNLKAEDSRKITLGIVLTNNTGQYLDLLFTPFIYFQTVTDLIGEYRKPTWPFSKQPNVFGYMESNFYSKEN